MIARRCGPQVASLRPANTMTRANMARPTEKTIWVWALLHPAPPASSASFSLEAKTDQA